MTRHWITAQRATAIAYVTSMFVTAMDIAIINVALPTLSRVFHASNASVQWAVIAYVLSLAIWIPASGRIADRIGTKRAFLIALAVFTLASALCGLARNLPELVAARALQGAGGGMLMPTGTSMLWRAYPPAQRARLGRLLILPILVAPAAAPVVGGLLVDHLSWRWIFGLNLPFGAIGLLFGALYLAEYREEAPGRFDVAGFLLSGAGLCLVLYALSEGALLGWTAPSVVAAAAAGLVSLAVFVRLELRRTFPILKVALLRHRLFRATNVTSAFSTASFLGILFLTPIFLQEAGGRCCRQLRADHVCGGDRGRGGDPDAGQALLACRSARHVHRRAGTAHCRHRVDDDDRCPDQPLGHPGDDVHGGGRQQHGVSPPADLDVHRHRPRRHR